MGRLLACLMRDEFLGLLSLNHSPTAPRLEAQVPGRLQRFGLLPWPIRPLQVARGRLRHMKPPKPPRPPTRRLAVAPARPPALSHGLSKTGIRKMIARLHEESAFHEGSQEVQSATRPRSVCVCLRDCAARGAAAKLCQMSAEDTLRGVF